MTGPTPRHPRELPADVLLRRYEAELPAFETTEQLGDVFGIIGQPRAAAAVAFGTGISRRGFNIFAFGLPGTGKRTFLQQYLESQARREPTPPDLCYVHNFDEPHKPKLLHVPHGRGAELHRDLAQLGEDLHVVIGAAFDSEEYQGRRQLIEDEFKERPEKRIAEIGEHARAAGLALLRTPGGLTFVPLKGEAVVSEEQFAALPEDERKRLEAEVERLQAEVQQTVRQMPRWNRERGERVRSLHREIASLAIEHPLTEIREKYRDLPEVQQHLDDLQRHTIEHAREIAGADAPAQAGPTEGLGGEPDHAAMRRLYHVNVLVDNAGLTGAPVVYEDNPTYDNLIGRIEHVAQFGALVTNHMLIKAGALHRANGGYLLLDMHRLLRNPFAWDTLKRALAARQIRIETPGQAFGLATTASLDPEPAPLDTQVILMGDPTLYYMVHTLDPDFLEHFKVAADFDETMEAEGEQIERYAHLLATLCRQESLRPLERAAVARVMEHSSRLVEDQTKLSARMAIVLDLLREADFWASEAEHTVVQLADVEHAITAQIARADRPRQRYLEAASRGLLLIDTDGARVGQVNGLVVASYGTFMFGHPTRITARVRIGEGEVLDIEREVELGGPIHSKGVLILGGFLGARYAPDRPLSLAATLVFEQSYGGVEGDSASAAELYALLSAIADLPLSQAVAVTGSVNQLGDIQAIGGVNEKIEGFFDTCQTRGLTGRQGVIIPQANARNLMLRRDVVEAVAAGRFHVFPIATVDEGLELLSGMSAGERTPDGSFPEGSFNAIVAGRLDELAELRRELGPPPPPLAPPHSSG
jgi:lon-related putative ATP-dependent protease